ncbi:MAG: hypothetical protein RMJ05_11430 [Thermomicrobium sp.]|nr:DUF4815 domain-containing protein [Thermomicrobium sp.]MDW8007311.1 hypothetical protein [Thermomicrobium sp.]
MRQYLARVLLAFALVCAALAAPAATAAAAWSPMAPVSSSWQVEEQLVVPYVPNNETIAGTGPWHGVVQIANASAFAVTVRISAADGTPILNVNVPGNGSTAVAAATLFGSSPGGGLLLQGEEAGPCAPQGVQVFTVTRGMTPDTADTVSLPVPSGITVTALSVAQASTVYPATAYSWSQTGTTLNVNWAPPTPPNSEPTGGSTYQVTVTYDFPCRPARISAVVKLVAPAPSVNARTSSSHLMVSGYAVRGRSQAVGDTLVAPIAQANYNGWKTVLHVTNVGGAACSVTARFYQHPSGAQTHAVPQTILAGDTWNLDLLAAGIPAGWLGTARIEGPGCLLVASVDRIKPTQPWGTPVNMALTNIAAPATTLGTTVFVPLVFQAYFDWNTGIAVTNAGSAPATVTISYYGMSGSLITTTSLPAIPANGMQFDYLTGSGGQLAQAVITSNQPIIVSVDAVKYTGSGSDVGQALTSMGIDAPVGATVLRAALYQKAGPSGNDTSGVQLFNTSATQPGNVLVEFFDTAGTAQPPSPLALSGIAPRGAVTVYAPSIGALPNDFQGQIRITHQPGSGQLVAITNNVNYDVQADGSASFNVATAARALRVDFGPTTPFNGGVPTFIVAQTVDENGVQMPTQQLLVSDGGAGLTITPAVANTSMFGVAVIELVGVNTTATVTVCWDLDTDTVCDPDEPQVSRSMSWTP